MPLSHRNHAPLVTDSSLSETVRRVTAYFSVAVATVEHHFPVLRWLPTYDFYAHIAADCTAAIAEAVVAVPEAISYASIAGVPAVNGLYAAMLGPIVCE